MCGVTLIKKRSSPKCKDYLDLEETINRLAKANKVRQCWYILRRENDDVLRKLLDFESVERKGEVDQRCCENGKTD